MNEWGIPDWRDAAPYAMDGKWTRNRWKWEFLRRRNDLRAEFDLHCQSTYRQNLEFNEWLQSEHPESVLGPTLAPDDPGFQIFSRILHWEMPNPRIGDQPEQAISWSWPDSSLRQIEDRHWEKGFLRMDFDLSAPLAPQIEAVEAAFTRIQIEREGMKLQARRHPAKWGTYLRVLDARSGGASWREISSILRATAGTEQTARDVHRQAKALCFNF